jgi:hypothetical protein
MRWNQRPTRVESAPILVLRLGELGKQRRGGGE